MKIGVMFGNPETTTGGNALKFYSSVRLDIRRIQAIKEGEAVIGNRTRVKVVKNKLAPPFREVEFDILYGEGISREGDLLELASNANIVEKSGTWYAYKDERIGQGANNARQWLKEHPAAMTEIRAEVLKKSNITIPSLTGGATTPAGATLAPPDMPSLEKPTKPEKHGMNGKHAAPAGKGHAPGHAGRR
jgi:recombination protein RecA